MKTTPTVKMENGDSAPILASPPSYRLRHQLRDQRSQVGKKRGGKHQIKKKTCTKPILTSFLIPKSTTTKRSKNGRSMGNLSPRRPLTKRKDPQQTEPKRKRKGRRIRRKIQQIITKHLTMTKTSTATQPRTKNKRRSSGNSSETTRFESSSPHSTTRPI